MDEKAKIEATRWLIRLQEQPDDRATDAAFRAWLAASASHAAAWAETQELGNLIAQSPPLYYEQWARRKPARRARLLVAAALAMAASVAIVFMSDLPLRLGADYATGTAELRSVALPDGSMARLAPESAIDIEYTFDRRQVRLRSGAAFFEVERDAARPFTVIAGDVETTVLGTAFDVRLTDDGTLVAVRRGAVQVENGGKRQALGPGDWIRASATDAVRGRKPPEQAGAWLRGELAARDEPISDVVNELRAYFHGTILVTDDALAAQRVTGLYGLDDPAQTLRAIALTQGATVQQISPWILVLSKD
jgi:transmembrane sensor